MTAYRTAPGTAVAVRRPPALAALLWLLRVTTAAGLAIDAYVHADLAATYDFVSRNVSQGDLFRAEAAASALAAALVLLFGRRWAAWLFAFAVAAAGVGAVVLYRYVDVGSLGPLPDMYEPLWYPEKTASVIAEGVAAATSLAGLALSLHPSLRPGSRRPLR